MHATHNPDGTHAEPVTRRIDGQPETDADRRFFDLRDSGYRGPIDQDGDKAEVVGTGINARIVKTDPPTWPDSCGCGNALPYAYTWDEPVCSDCVTPDMLPDSSDGYTGGIDRAGSPADAIGTCDICGTGNTPVQLVTDPDERVPHVVCVDAAACMSHFHDEPIPVVLIPPPVGQDITELQEPPACVLRSAADYLERHGWIQGSYYDAASGVFAPPACMVGAIGMVCYGGPVDAPAQHFDDPGFLDFEQAVLHLDRYLLVAEDGTESYEFNDARGRTVEQVMDVLRKAAAVQVDELIDALRAIDAKNADVAVLVELLKPCGIWGDTAAPASSDGGDGE